MNKSTSALARRVLATIVEHRMMATGDRVLVAVSGGPDSTALLSILSDLAAEQRFELEAAHLNHGLRGAEAERDQRHVQELCARLDVRCHVGRASFPEGVSNIEERARAARYRFLFEQAGALRCNRIATGHTADDQAETVVMRLIRGAGVDGLASILPCREDGVIRPLIECERRALMVYLESRGISYVSDSMNADPRFLRTRVRQEIVPALRALNPRLTRSLARTARLAAADAALLDTLAAEAVERCSTPTGGIDTQRLLALPEALGRRAVRRWLWKQRGTLRGLGAVHLKAAFRLAQGSGPARRVEMPCGGRILREQGELRYTTAADVVNSQPVEIVEAGTATLGCGWRVRASLEVAPPELPPEDASLWRAWIDANEIGATMQFRSAVAGDRIAPLGMEGHRKLQDVFVDCKVPRPQRWGRPVLEVNGDLLWVPGVIRSRHALLKPSTRMAWRIAIDDSAVAGWKSLC